VFVFLTETKQYFLFSPSPAFGAVQIRNHISMIASMESYLTQQNAETRPSFPDQLLFADKHRFALSRRNNSIMQDHPVITGRNRLVNGAGGDGSASGRSNISNDSGIHVRFRG
jgi:hypothetical protein